VAKGNLREAGIGEIFMDDRGRTLWVYAMDCGNASNNEVEFYVLNRVIEIAIREGYQKLQIEGDLKLMIDTLKQLHHQVQAII